MQFVYKVMGGVLESGESQGTDFLKQNKPGPHLTINHFE